MLTLKLLNGHEATSFFQHEPKICFDGLPDVELHELYHTGKWRMPPNTKMLGVISKNKIIAILRYSPFSNIAYNMHLYVAFAYTKSIKYRAIVRAIVEWMKENEEHTKLIIMSPTCCKQVHRAAKLFGFVEEGRIKDVVIWRQKLEDCIILGCDLNGIR